MEVLLNGQPHRLEHAATVREMLQELDLASQRVAVLLNDEVVRKARFDDTPLTEGDRVEIVQMVGGG